MLAAAWLISNGEICTFAYAGCAIKMETASPAVKILIRFFIDPAPISFFVLPGPSAPPQPSILQQFGPSAKQQQKNRPRRSFLS